MPRFALVVPIVLVAAAGASAQTARFVPIPGKSVSPARNESACLLSGTTGYSSVRVSADGKTLTTTIYPPGTYTGYIPRSIARWTAATGTVEIAPFDSNYAAVGISADGTTIFGDTWRWTKAGGYQDLLPSLRNEIGQQIGYIFGCSDDAQTVAGIQGMGLPFLPIDMFSWRINQTTTKTILPRAAEVPTGYFYFNTISGDGRIVAGSTRNFDPFDPLVPTNYAAVVIGPSGPRLITGETSDAGVTDLSFDGSIAVGYVKDGPKLRAFRWSDASELEFLDEGTAGVDGSYARAVSSNGSIVVGDAIAFGVEGTTAWIWTPKTKFVDLKSYLEGDFDLGAVLTGWQLLVATDVSANGRVIVGQGVNPDGCEQSFLVDLGPECGSDFNGDGFVNGDDFDAYVLAFEGGNALADFDKNGFVNGDDFDAYVLSFEAGC